VNPSFIPVKRICKDCKYFIGDTLQCRKFGDTNIVTGEVTYPYASVIRGDSKKCGEVGNHFENNPYKLVTGPYYFVTPFYISNADFHGKKIQKGIKSIVGISPTMVLLFPLLLCEKW